MTTFAILFTMAAIGLAETSYLFRKRIAAQAPICPIGGSCLTVLTSKYNKTAGVHNDILGILFYTSAGVLTALLVLEVGSQDILSTLLTLMVLGAAFMSLVFTYLQWKVIKAWCTWCLLSAATVAVMTGIVFLHYSSLIFRML